MTKNITVCAAALALCLVATATSAQSTTYVWDMACSEDQVNNSGVGDGSTDSAAIGQAAVRYDGATERVYYDVSWAGLEGLLEKIHIHGPAPPSGSNTNHVFDIFSSVDEVLAAGVGQTTGGTSKVETLVQLILDSGGVGLPTLEENVQVMVDDEAYVNIHTSLWPMGEIRCHFVTDQVLVDAEQTKDQRKCTGAMNKGFAKVSALQAKLVCGCVKNRTKGKLTGTVESCIVTDPGKVADAQAKVSDDFTARCSGMDKNGAPKLPAFGTTDAATVNGAAVTKELDLIHAVFGPDLDVSIDDGSNPMTGKCQSAVAKAAKKCQAAKLKEYRNCVKADLKGKEGLTIVDEFGLELCMGLDRKGKIAKACDPSDGKIRSTLEKSCAEVDLVSAVPGCARGDVAVAASCVDALVECEVCRALNEANATARDCDLFDDGVANASCTP